MKIVFLNTWGASRQDELFEWLMGMKNHVDIFCFQEVFTITSRDQRLFDFYATLENIFDYAFVGRFMPTQNGFMLPDARLEGEVATRYLSGGLAIFYRRNLRMTAYREQFIVGSRDCLEPKEVAGTDYTVYSDRLPRALQMIRLKDEDGHNYLVGNYHGIWQRHGKGDCPERIEQSNRIVETMNEFLFTMRLHPTTIILGGDFNLVPNTRSIDIIRNGLGLYELVTIQNIQSTRTSLYTKPCRFADYVFVSKDIAENSFALDVPDIPISDHRPLILEF